MDPTFQLIITIGVCVIAVAFLGQLIALGVVAFVALKIKTQVMTFVPKVHGIVDVVQRTSESVEKNVKKIGDNASAIADITKQQAQKVDEFLTDASTRAKVQMERAEMVLDDAMGRTQETVSIVQRTVLRPVRELHGVFSGIRTTLAYLGRSSRPTVDHATADEEMFI